MVDDSAFVIATFVDGPELGALVLVIEEGEFRRLAVHDYARCRDRDVHLPGWRHARPALHLHSDIRAVVESVQHPVDADVAQRKKHVQPADRLPHQLGPHLELGDLARRERLSAKGIAFHSRHSRS